MARLNPMKNLWLFATRIIHTDTHWLEATKEKKKNETKKQRSTQWIPISKMNPNKMDKVEPWAVCVVRCSPDQMGNYFETLLHWLIHRCESSFWMRSLVLCVISIFCLSMGFGVLYVEFAIIARQTRSKRFKAVDKIFTKCLLEIRQPKHNLNRDAS